MDNQMLISSMYHRAVPKKDVAVRRVNRETMRSRLAKASFIPVARLLSRGEVISRITLAR